MRAASDAGGNTISVTTSDPPRAEMVQLKKGSAVTIPAKLRDFVGTRNEYIALEDGNCKVCNR